MVQPGPRNDFALEGVACLQHLGAEPTSHAVLRQCLRSGFPGPAARIRYVRSAEKGSK